jgi:hypothetical protein
MTETAEQFIERKQRQWTEERDSPIRTKDIGRGSTLSWRREAWTLRPQSNYRAKVFSIERLRLIGEDGERAYADGAVVGDVEYRVGYWTVGRVGRAAGRWVCG